MRPFVDGPQGGVEGQTDLLPICSLAFSQIPMGAVHVFDCRSAKQTLQSSRRTAGENLETNVGPFNARALRILQSCK
jgi:hypothetical protein